MSVFYILENSLDLLYLVTDQNGVILGSNQLYKEYTSHLKTKKVKDLVYDDTDVESLIESVKKAKENTPSAVRFYAKTKQKSGAARWILWNVYYIGKSIHYIGIQIHDVTTITQNEYDRQKVLLEEFRFMLSHELRQPLTSISSLVNLMTEKGCEDPEEHLKMLQMIGDSVSRLDDSIRALVKKAAREL